MLGLSNQEILYYYFDNTDDMTDEQLAEYTFSQQLMTMKYTAKQMAGSCPTVRTVSVKKYQMSL